MNRLWAGKLVVMALLLFAGCQGPFEGRDSPDGDESGQPWVFVGDTINLGFYVWSVDLRAPLFRTESLRETGINPEIPEISGGGINFRIPGTYFLTINQSTPVSIMVFDSDGPDLQNVRTVFQFFTSNNATTNADDERVSNAPGEYLSDLQRLRGPMQLSCGPTLAMMRLVIESGLQLPTRAVSWPGWHYADYQITTGTHNAMDVWLPDEKRWIYLDSNSSFFAPNHSSVQLSREIAAVAGSPNISTLAQSKALTQIIQDANESWIESYIWIDQDVGTGTPYSDTMIDWERPRNGDSAHLALATQMLFGVRFFGEEVRALTDSGLPVLSDRAVESSLPPATYLTFINWPTDNLLIDANTLWHRRWGIDDQDMAYLPMEYLAAAK